MVTLRGSTQERLVSKRFRFGYEKAANDPAVAGAPDPVGLGRDRSEPARFPPFSILIFGAVRSTLCGAMPTKAVIARRAGKPKSAKREQIRLLIADDHALILEGLAANIGRQDDMTVVAKAADGWEAVELWKKHRPDGALLDLRMPRLNGVEAWNRM